MFKLDNAKTKYQSPQWSNPSEYKIAAKTYDNKLLVTVGINNNIPLVVRIDTETINAKIKDIKYLYSYYKHDSADPLSEAIPYTDEDALKLLETFKNE